jgi:peptidoglycan/LPS O-acetylase OafA/YrhL
MVNDKDIAQSNSAESHAHEDAPNEVETPSKTRHSYLPGLDGLRAVAVMAVLFYHAEVAWMPGGFLGVEVFFVISGYLITGLLIAEWRRTGGIKLGQFWLRRARRLLPAVFALLIAVLTFAVIFLPDEVASLRYDALAAAFYVSNWFQIFSHKSYFEAIGRPSLLRHMWSLAVEEQFYLVWPVALLLYLKLVTFLKGKRAGKTESVPDDRNAVAYRIALVAFSFIGAVASALLMAALYNPDADPSRIYYGTDTRAAGFLIGATLAILVPAIQEEGPLSVRLGWLLDIAGSLALVALTLIFVLVSEINPYLYLGGFTVVAICTIVAIYATVRNGSRLFTRFLSLPVIRWIGLRSYSIYLWHWPIFAVTRPQLDIQLDGLPLMVLRLGLTAICAELSYRYIEQPIRQGALGRLWKKLRQASPLPVRLQWIGTGVVSIALLLTLGVAVVRAQPPAVPEEYAEAGDTIATPTLVSPTPTHVAPTGTAISVRQVITPTATRAAKPTSATRTAVTATVTATVSQSITAPVVTATMAITPTAFVTPEAEVSPTAAVTETPLASDATPTPVLATVDTATAPLTETPTAVAEVTSTPQTITDATTLTDVLGANYHITAIGDSVMKGAAVEMQQAMGNIEVDAVVGRQAAAALADLRQRHDAGTLGNLVIMHVGNNGFITQKQMDEMMQVLADVPRVIFINVHVPLRWEGPNNALIADAVSKAPNAVLIDWNGITEGQTGLFAGDGVHLQPAARVLYTQLIMNTIKAPYLAQHNTTNASQQAQ